jgi:hypothetical protein
MARFESFIKFSYKSFRPMPLVFRKPAGKRQHKSTFELMKRRLKAAASEVRGIGKEEAQGRPNTA